MFIIVIQVVLEILRKSCFINVVINDLTLERKTIKLDDLANTIISSLFVLINKFTIQIKFYPFVLVVRFKNILKDKMESKLIVDKNSFNAYLNIRYKRFSNKVKFQRSIKNSILTVFIFNSNRFREKIK